MRDDMPGPDDTRRTYCQTDVDDYGNGRGRVTMECRDTGRTVDIYWYPPPARINSPEAARRQGEHVLGGWKITFPPTS